VEESRRRLLAFLSGSLVGIGGTLAAIPFIRSLWPAGHVKPPVYYRTFEFPKLKPGQMIAVPAGSKPLYVLRRTPEQIAALTQPNEGLRDPQSTESRQPELVKNEMRSIRPDVFVAWGTCTHLGCSVSNVQAGREDFSFNREFQANGGFFCPCHGAMYDAAGRVYKNMPAQRNLDIPEYEFVDQNTIRITDQKAF
jgi:ubiquinol-cytochrome c reductase iron-sulfur subunit